MCVKTKVKKGRPPGKAPLHYKESAVARLRHTIGKSKRDMARDCGIHYETFRDIERRGHMKNKGVSRTNAQLISAATGVSAAGLMQNKLYPIGWHEQAFTKKHYEVHTDSLNPEGGISKYLVKRCASLFGEIIQEKLESVAVTTEPPRAIVNMVSVALAFDDVQRRFGRATTEITKELLNHLSKDKESGLTPIHRKTADAWISLIASLAEADELGRTRRAKED